MSCVEDLLEAGAASKSGAAASDRRSPPRQADRRREKHARERSRSSSCSRSPRNDGEREREECVCLPSRDRLLKPRLPLTPSTLTSRPFPLAKSHFVNRAMRDDLTVLVQRIHPRADDFEIFEFFSQAGKVRDIRLIRDQRSNKSKGGA